MENTKDQYTTIQVRSVDAKDLSRIRDKKDLDSIRSVIKRILAVIKFHKLEDEI